MSHQLRQEQDKNPQSCIGGRLMEYIIDEEMNDEDTPIEGKYAYVHQYGYEHEQHSTKQRIRSIIYSQSGATIKGKRAYSYPNEQNSEPVAMYGYPPMNVKQGPVSINSTTTASTTRNNCFNNVAAQFSDHDAKENDDNIGMFHSPMQEAMGYYCSDETSTTRMNRQFIQYMIRKDFNAINYSNVKLIKSRFMPSIESITIQPSVLAEYCYVAAKRLNTTNDNGRNNLIPIQVADHNKFHNLQSIEWVLIVHIAHSNQDMGISFRRDIQTNTFIATAIYLDKEEIESRHILIGLDFNYCKYLRPFSSSTIIFNKDRHSIIDNDDAPQQPNMRMATQQPNHDFINGFMNLPTCIRDITYGIYNQINLDPSLMMAADLMELPKVIRNLILSIQIYLEPGVYVYVSN